jgi:tetratricopeptide (TPR) repeat protein
MRTAFLLALLLAAAPLARAEAPAVDDTAEARARFRSGTELYQAGKLREAAAEFETAYRLKPHGTIHFNVAQCRDRLGEWPAALRAYSDYLREVPDAKDRAAVRASMKRIEGKLAATGVQALLVYTDPPGAEVKLDGRTRGRAPFHTVLPPGAYALQLALEGRATVEQEVTMPADASVTVDVVLPPLPAVAPTTAAAPAAKPDLSAPAPKASPLAGRPLGADAQPVLRQAQDERAPRAKRRLWTWVAAGAAVAAASAGAYYGLAAKDAESKLHDGTSAPDALADEAKGKARTANALYGVAGAAAAAGVTLFFVEGRF